MSLCANPKYTAARLNRCVLYVEREREKESPKQKRDRGFIYVFCTDVNVFLTINQILTILFLYLYHRTLVKWLV